jgi:hypothetical protein
MASFVDEVAEATLAGHQPRDGVVCDTPLLEEQMKELQDETAPEHGTRSVSNTNHPFLHLLH